MSSIKSFECAWQVLHRSGLQFFEVASYAIATGLVALVVFRGLLQRPFGAVWDFPDAFPEVDYRHVLLGAGFWLYHEAHGVAVSSGASADRDQACAQKLCMQSHFRAIAPLT